MQNDDDDIERLLRRAADSYPLNTNGANWEKVAAALDNEKEILKGSFFKNKSMQSLLLLLFIIVASFITFNFYQAQNTTALSKPNSVIINSLPKKEPKTNYNKEAQEQNTLTAKNNNRNKIINLNEKTIANAFKDNKAVTNNNVRFNNNPLKAIQYNATSPIGVNSKSELKANVVSPGGMETVSLNNPDKAVPANAKVENPEVSTNETSVITKDFQSKAEKSNSVIPKEAAIEDSTKQGNNKTITSIKKSTKKSPTGLYMFLIFGPDLSNIKSQAYDKSGLSAGLLLGYTYNRLSLESGIIWDKKYYSTDGKYYNPKTTPGVPQYSKPISLSGLCYMYEVPLNIGISVLQNKTNKLKVKTGLSSYFIKNESYDYSYLYYNQVAYGTANYKNSSSVIFSELNLELNYSHRLSKGSALGIEPYFKVPLKQIGFGRMNISSIGVYVVYSIKF